MEKYADRHFAVAPWRVEELGFDPAYAEVGESVFSLGNEYTGLRGYFEEGYSGKSLQGSYLNGVYERRTVHPLGYGGMLPFTEFMVNTVDWVYCRIRCNGVSLDLGRQTAEGFRRTLELRTGVLEREFLWRPDGSTLLRLRFERFLSMEEEQLGGQSLEIEVLEGHGSLAVTAGLDFSRVHATAGENLFDQEDATADGNTCEIAAHTRHTGQRVWAGVRFSLWGEAAPREEKKSSLLFHAELNAGERFALRRVAALVCARNAGEERSFARRTAAARHTLETADYDALKAGSAAWWTMQWALSDIEIEGDDENQQGIRFCIFQLHQTLHRAGHGAVFGAKGLTGESYNGNTFWDSEVYCLPFYLFNNPTAARSILQFRYDTLPQARERAAALDCRGAFYPVATISGRECCDLWQHASLQLQPSTGVAYGLWNYVHITGDRDFLFHPGAELLAEISRMLASRGDFDQATGRYGFYAVMGPDEFKMMGSNNAYTNFMGKKTLLFALATLAAMERERPEAYESLRTRLGLTAGELADWADKAERMFLPVDAGTGLWEQQDGFFRQPHTDIGAIPAEDFPLYYHWSYDRIFRGDMLKQPDVLMFQLLYPSEFTREELCVNFDYYEPRCIHESSLSPSVHSILAAWLGRLDKAEAYFRFATRMDLDNYNRNTREGLHTTSIAGSWMNIVYGFGGLHSDEALLSLAPSIPARWRSYAFRLLADGGILCVRVGQKTVELVRESGGPLELLLYGRRVTATREARCFPLGGG